MMDVEVAERVEPSQVADPGARHHERRVTGWIGKAVRVEGRVISTEDLTIDGDVEGSIELGDNSLMIGLGANVKADLTAKTIVINGVVTGNVRATDQVDLRTTGAVYGNLTTPRLLMADGATVLGKVDCGKRQAPPQT
jgi:cytoskeletal protein CcmA (bactofilin family)